MRISVFTATLGLLMCTISLAARASLKLIRKTGDFAYICTFHPTMKATLRVK